MRFDAENAVTQIFWVSFALIKDIDSLQKATVSKSVTNLTTPQNNVSDWHIITECTDQGDLPRPSVNLAC
jgi:hypothetical protein